MIHNYFKNAAVAFLLVSSCTLFAEDTLDDSKVIQQQETEQNDGSPHDARPNFDLLKKRLDEAATYVGGLFLKGKKAVQDKWEKATTSKQANTAQEAVLEGYKKISEGVQKGKDTLDKAAEKVATTVDKKAKGVVQNIKTWWYGDGDNGSQNFLNSLSSQELMMLGAGVVAVVVICGVTYVLYKNGTVAHVSKNAQDHPHLTVLSATAAMAVIVGVYLIYLHGLPTISA